MTLKTECATCGFLQGQSEGGREVVWCHGAWDLVALDPLEKRKPHTRQKIQKFYTFRLEARVPLLVSISTSFPGFVPKLASRISCTSSICHQCEPGWGEPGQTGINTLYLSSLSKVGNHKIASRSNQCVNFLNSFPGLCASNGDPR